MVVNHDASYTENNNKDDNNNNYDNRQSLPQDVAQVVEDVDDNVELISSVHSTNLQNNGGATAPRPIPSESPSTPTPGPNDSAITANAPANNQAASAELAHERQTLLLMLLGQVCSLHDATPRTFVVHVIALYERGILDESSIRFLFDLGLVPKSTGFTMIGDGGGGAEIGGRSGDEMMMGRSGEDEGDCCGKDGVNENADTTSLDDNNNFTASSTAGERSTTTMESRKEEYQEKNNETTTTIRSKRDETAIVPYCAQTQHHHPWTQHLPLPSSSLTSTTTTTSNLNRKNTSQTTSQTKNGNNNTTLLHHSRQSSNNDDDDDMDHNKQMERRKKEASAIRKHLEHHESLESSNNNTARGSVFGSFQTQGISSMGVSSSSSSTTTTTTTSAAPPSSSNNQTNNRGGWNTMNRTSTATQSTLTSAEESFDNPSFRGHHLRNNTNLHNGISSYTSSQQQQQQQPQPLPSSQHPTTATTTQSTNPYSWSVEHHPLSLSRYQREFHQVSLLATGSFGSVYHAIHRLEQRPYAVKRVTFSTSGYYANALALVIREVRCLAQLNHGNVVRYYTSWLEPSWMTGDHGGKEGDLLEGQEEESDEEYDDEYDDDDDDDDDYGEDYGLMHHHHPLHPRRASGKRENTTPKLLTDIERVIEGLHNTEEIDTSVEQLKALLYGNEDEKGEITMDDGFDWGSSSSSSSSSSNRNGSSSSQMDASSWGDLPSHRTTNDDGGEREDASEWTRDVDNSSGHVGIFAAERHRDSLRNSQGRNNYRRQGSSLELVPAGNNNNNPPHNRRRYKRRSSSSAAAVASPSAAAAAAATTYKYQISFYIQMQLCHPSTLADWIKHRNGNCVDFDGEEIQARARPAFEIFRQIVNGLAHVHSKGIIHRDLKPANIFAGDDGFLLGDFGLSKMVIDANNTHSGADNNNNPSSQTNAIILPTGYINDNIHTAGVGTASYASPEQITSKNYTTAADIYSLGLILLELFGNFTSEHERAKAFHECRRDGVVAPWMKRYYREVSALILACTQEDWERRPTAMDIQAAGVFQEKGNGAEIFRAELRALKVEMARKDGVIQSQKEEMREKDEMIENLRRRLAEVESGMGVKVVADTVGKSPAGVEDSSSASDDDY